jgi:zinc transport system substrate-binding protein
MSEVEKENGKSSGWPVAAEACFGLAGIVLAVTILSAFGSPREATLDASDVKPLETFAGIPPVAYLVNRIGGPYVRAEVLVQPGQDPHIFEPTPRQVVRLSQAKLFFKIGMPFENHLAEHIAAGPTNILVIDTAAGIAKRTDACKCGHEECDHDHDDESTGDPHVWLSPRLLKHLAGNVATALAEADPPHAPIFRTNLAVLTAELDLLDRRIAESLAPFRGQAFYVFHPAFGYFADAYGLRQESVEVEGKSPTPRQLFGLIGKARADRVKIIFLQPQYNQQVATSVAEAIGGTVMPMDSLSYDVLATLKDIADKMAASSRKETP